MSLTVLYLCKYTELVAGTEGFEGAGVFPIRDIYSSSCR